MPTTPTEEDLLSLFRRLSTTSDQAALWQLHAHYFHRIYAYVLSIVPSKETAEEITNDIFVDIWQGRHLLANVSRPELYLFVCAKNKAIRYLKKKSLTFESLDEATDIECVLEKDPYELLISSEMLKFINDAISSLPCASSTVAAMTSTASAPAARASST